MTAARPRPSLAATAAATVLATLAALTAAAPVAVASPPGNTVRFATFNASLNRATAGELVRDLSTPSNAQASNVAEVIQRERPDVLLINEFDFDAAGQALALFQDNYLSVAHNGAAPIDYPYAFTAPSNTGIPSGFDLNNNNSVGGPDDALGFGFFPGQFGMAVYSQYPIDLDAVRTFQNFKWKDMPGNRMPPGWYSPEEQAVLPVSSKSHWDLPIQIGKRSVHFLTSHPTPPVFDGTEDRNGRRNFDEIRLWADYITPGAGDYIYDDEGGRGGLAPGESFVIAGDQNSDPLDGDSIPGAVQQLIENPGVNSSHTPESAGATEASALQGGANLTHRSDPRFDTADFNDSAPGNLRADYVLPSSDLRIWDSGVFWPVQADPLFRLTGVFTPSLPGGFPTSDHRSVWVDVRVPGASSPAR
jgi:Endonuclease/Exonuclease/phosphatase family